MTSLPAKAFPIVLAAPSGTGKTSIARALVEGPGNFVFSVSATTRPPRGQERDGVDYHFVSEAEFCRMVDEGELVEWAEVHGAMYGTPRAAIEGPGATGQHVVLDIDVLGAGQIRERIPEAILVFVFPPSAKALLARLTRRGTEDRADVERRLANARTELAAADSFDYVVVNESLDEAIEAVRAIVASERHRPARADSTAREIRRVQDEIDDVLSVSSTTDREG